MSKPTDPTKTALNKVVHTIPDHYGACSTIGTTFRPLHKTQRNVMQEAISTRTQMDPGSAAFVNIMLGMLTHDQQTPNLLPEYKLPLNSNNVPSCVGDAMHIA